MLRCGVVSSLMVERGLGPTEVLLKFVRSSFPETSSDLLFPPPSFTIVTFPDVVVVVVGMFWLVLQLLPFRALNILKGSNKTG